MIKRLFRSLGPSQHFRQGGIRSSNFIQGQPQQLENQYSKRNILPPTTQSHKQFLPFALRTMYCDVPEAAYYLGYASPASLYRLINAGLLKEYIEDYEGQILLRMGSKGKSPTLAKRVRALVNFRGGHEIFMFDPKEEESLQKIRDRHYEKSSKNISQK